MNSKYGKPACRTIKSVLALCFLIFVAGANAQSQLLPRQPMQKVPVYISSLGSEEYAASVKFVDSAEVRIGTNGGVSSTSPRAANQIAAVLSAHGLVLKREIGLAVPAI